MDFYSAFKNKIFSVNENNFDLLALELFQFQAQSNPVYHSFLNAMQIEANEVTKISQIPFMPVEFFKHHKVLCKGNEVKHFFESSGTTSSVKAKHFIPDLNLYEHSFINSFIASYGHPENYHMFALMPDAASRPHSSLIYMVSGLLEISGKKYSGFYYNRQKELSLILQRLVGDSEPVLLIGLSYALMDFAEKHASPLRTAIIMETGGMKGVRDEIPKKQMHDYLKLRFVVKDVHSEYGMTELLSQAYSTGEGVFSSPPWMRILIRDQRDPLQILAEGEKGCINIIDLANLYSCAFLATQDLGALINKSTFRVEGRMDHSDIRGCNLILT